MAVTSGFFNSVEGDRKYNAEQLSNFFGCVISSGVLPNPSTNLQVKAKTGMTVSVEPGRGFIDTHWVYNDADLDLTLDTADSILNRYDAIIMKLDLSMAGREIRFEVKKGTPATSPTKPKMERTAAYKEYCLAYVYVGRAVTQVTQSNITDTRADNTVCGWVTHLINQVDTSTLFIQWQTAYEEFYQKMQDWLAGSQDDFDQWKEEIEQDLKQWQQETESAWKRWEETQKATWESWQSGRNQEFNEWFESLQTNLSGDVAGNLLNLINNLTADVQSFYDDVYAGIMKDNLITDDGYPLILDTEDYLYADWKICECG